jgi:hypothetical protein
MPTHTHPPAINGLAVLPWLRSAILVGVGMAGLLACDGPQSALDPAGRAAEQIARLFWKMAVGAVLVWLAMAGLTIYAMRGASTAMESRLAKFLIIGGGAIVPTAVLAALLVYGLAMMANLLARAPEGSLKIAVTGEQRHTMKSGVGGATAARVCRCREYRTTCYPIRQTFGREFAMQSRKNFSMWSNTA